jgi:hypothetical protein
MQSAWSETACGEVCSDCPHNADGDTDTMPPKPPRATSPYDPVGTHQAGQVHTPNHRQSRQELLSGARHVTAEEPPDRHFDDYPDTAFLDPDQASIFLKRVFNLARGPRRLAQLRAEGTGPKYFRDGNVVRYQPRHLREYGERCLGEPVSSTAEESAKRQIAAV